jgi:endonuclease V-like protein UPF0215 family
MKTVRIRQVKKEIRVLGIAAKSSNRGRHLNIIGVIYRGGLWLDGVLRTTAPGPDITDATVETITKSSHLPQIRVIILHNDLIEKGASIDPCKLATGTSRPVISLSAAENQTSNIEECADLVVKRRLQEIGGNILQVFSVGLSSNDATEILNISMGRGAMPEALRVADLIAQTLANGSDQNV